MNAQFTAVVFPCKTVCHFLSSNNASYCCSIVVTCSQYFSVKGGNAGLAAAYAGRKLKMPTTVVVPEITPDFTIERIKEEGANVIVKGKVDYTQLLFL